jgi:cytochrome P450
MLYRDPPDHTRLRRLVSKAFTPRAVQALGPRITGLVDSMLDAAERAGRVDLVDALAFPLPFAVIAEMLGTPPGPSSWPAWARRTGTRGSGGRTPPNSGSTGRARASTSRSAAGRITAWARRWPGWRPQSPSRG